MSEELKSNSKEDLPLRNNLVDTAVGFLLNPSVKQRPDDAKIAFLKQKGLTDAEIDKAFNRAKFEPAVSNEDSLMVNAYPLPPYQTSYSFGYHLRNFCSAFASFAVAAYVFHRFYKSYIEPWLFGSKSEQSEMTALKQQLTELNNSVSRLTSTVTSLEEAVNNQIHLIDRTSLYGVESVPKSVKDIQDEVTNVKSLLLNRFSFPAPPVLAGASVENKTSSEESKTSAKVVTIPKWQLRSSEPEKAKESQDAEKMASGPTSLENGLSSVEDQTQDQEINSKIAKDKIQNENFTSTLENDLNAEDKIQSKDAKTASFDEDSGIESHNYLSDSESADQANKRSISIKDSE